MEERVASGNISSVKDKKYVLYTVVGEDRARTTPAAWMIRVLLGSLMIVALAVVPYVSLRLAQANSRTLVVFQPVPMHNRTGGHHTLGGHRAEGLGRSSKQVKLMQVADLTLENYTSSSLLSNETEKENSNVTAPGNIKDDITLNVTTNRPSSSLEVINNLNNSIIVTLHESDVTIAVLEDKNASANYADKILNNTKLPAETTINPQAETPTEYATDIPKITTTIKTVLVDNDEKTSTLKSDIVTVTSWSSTATANISKVIANLTSSWKPTTSTSNPVKRIASTTTMASKRPIPAKNLTLDKSTDTIATKIASTATKHKALFHKLIYIATASSGNHVGGICLWKVDKNNTDWSYFYDNIPIEFQSGHDAGDHELRATLAAVRTWSTDWQDAHATLRSQHSAIEHSDLAVRRVLVDELEKRSDGHFTYELEWRLPEADTLVKIASSLSRLHQDYKFWFQDFKSHVDELLGKQDWENVIADKHVKVSDDSFFTDENVKPSETKINSSSENLISIVKPKSKINRPLSHKLVYVATSSSGNHVGGFCLWKLDKNNTSWSYFYDNIPVEYQSNHDSADHEQRATLAAVRVWAPLWQDAHVTLRSQHAVVERTDNLIRKALIETLDKLSDRHFTYELEWRLRKSDDLIKISFSLSRLHRNFAHWFAVFKASVDDVLGTQDWDVATTENRVMLTDEHFYTKEIRPQVNQSTVQSTLAELQR